MLKYTKHENYHFNSFKQTNCFKYIYNIVESLLYSFVWLNIITLYIAYCFTCRYRLFPFFDCGESHCTRVLQTLSTPLFSAPLDIMLTVKLMGYLVTLFHSVWSYYCFPQQLENFTFSYCEEVAVSPCCRSNLPNSPFQSYLVQSSAGMCR